MIRLASRSLIETRSIRRTWAARGLAGVASAGGPVGGGEGRRREAEPLLAGVLHLAELVADHQLLDRRRAGSLSLIDSTK